MENNTPPSNSEKKRCRWFLRHGTLITNLLLVVTNVLLVCATGLIVYFAYAQSKSLENQTVSLEKQTESVRLQAIAVKNSRENLPELRLSFSIIAINSFFLSIEHKPGNVKNLKVFETHWVKIVLKSESKVFPVKFTCLKKDKLETKGEISLTFIYASMLDDIIRNCNVSTKIYIVPFAVIHVSLDDMFGIADNRYYYLRGMVFPNKPIKDKETVRLKSNSLSLNNDDYDFDKTSKFDYIETTPNFDRIPEVEGQKYFSDYKEEPVSGKQEICDFITGLNLKERTPQE